ncbi:Bromo domain-containing protein [Heracleum sosnowskyi]|uniref:Bromo domain-containing protein n=1 Tax=Heracleum sosnowskyi TaxID=360622 RepID=A0AAD8IW28_9APIA|nr:Bromo domain-containing protein [Heracleum sosnowskyi]
MVQIVQRKKKGRPSKSDLARRSSNSPPAKSSETERQLRRSGRRRNVRYTFDFDDYIDEDFDYYDDDDENDRRDKKLMMLLKLQSCGGAESPPSSTRRASPSSSEGKAAKKRKIDDADDDDDVDEEDDDENDNDVVDSCDDDNNDEVKSQEKVEAKGIESVPGTPVDCSSGLPLPDKKTLELILDKLQKKDIYGVYAEPVDPEELPDYHEVIKNPMDFSTVRKKLGSGKYSTFEQFEHDVFLICENAMQYNSSDTIYFKQAFSIQELARRKFQRLRNELDYPEKELKVEEKTTSNSFPKKQIKKQISRTLQEPVGSDFSSGATLAIAGDVANGSNLPQTVVCEKPNSVDKIIEGNVPSIDNIMDRGEELVSGKGLSSRPVRKASVLDENRRATYNMSIPSATASESIFTTFEGESKQLIPVGVNADHSYAWSLARFAATLGSVAWKVASHRIEQALPEGFKYGRGWVGEYEPLPTPVLMLENRTLNDSVPQRFPCTSEMTKECRTVRAPLPGKEAPFAGSTSVELPLSGLPDARPNNSSSSVRVSVKEEPLRVTSLDGKSSFVSSPRTRHIDHRATYQQQNMQSRNFAEPEKNVLNHVGLSSPLLANHRLVDAVGGKTILRAPETLDAKPAETVSLNRSTLQSAVSKQQNVNGVFSGRVPNGQARTSVIDSRMATSISSNPKQKGGTETYFPNSQAHSQEQGLSDPVQLMRMLTEKDQRQHSLNHSPNGSSSTVSSSPLVKREDSSNAAAAAARAWMSIGAGGFKPAAENNNTHKGQLSVDPVYSARDHQPHLSRFRGEYPATAIQFHSDKSNFPVHAFVPQPVRVSNEGQFQNQPMVFPQHVSPDLSRFQMQAPWRGPNPQSQPRQRQESLPPDLNIGYQSSGSPARQSSGVLVDTQQPDLALQL